jgi:hypothetical protein
MSNIQSNKRKRCGSEPPNHAPGVQTRATKKPRVEGAPSMFVGGTNIEEVNKKRKWEGAEASGRKRLRSVEPEMLKPEVRKPKEEKEKKEEKGEKGEKAEEKEKEEPKRPRTTSGGGFAAFANVPSGFGTFPTTEKKAPCTCLHQYEGLTGKVVNGQFVPHVGQSAQAGTFNFSGFRESGNGGTFGAGFGSKPKQEQLKQKQPEQKQPKQEKPKEKKPEEKKESVKPDEKPKAQKWEKTEFVEPEEKPEKEYRHKGEYHDEKLASKIKIPDYKPKPAPRPEKRTVGDSSSYLYESKEPLNRPQKKPGKFKVKLNISDLIDTVRGEKVKRLASQEYKDWVKACMVFFGQQKTGEEEKTAADAGTNTTSTTSTTDDIKFPKITRGFCKLEAYQCVKGELLDFCQHDVQRCLKGSGANTEGEPWLEKLKKERIRWHPDKFAHKMGKKFEKEAQEFFQILQALVKKAEKDLGK